MKSRDEVLEILTNQKLSLLEAYQITRLGIFGSYARDQQTEASDLDVLVDYHQPLTLPRLIDLRDELSEMVEMKVDVVTPNGLKPTKRDRALSEVIYLE